ncbi:MAG: ribulose-phosphate 3-epimerase [Bacilli bacterium]|nr:ribulose-phosphate 3-epimerase [Bacilli bacterium]
MIVSPSILAANKERLVEEVKLAESLGAEFLHFDVMDGKFVPNTSYTIADLDKIAPHHTMVNDVHIMVVDPEVEAIDFANHGADIVTFHIEALNDEKRVNELIKNLHKLNCKVGISVKPNTEVEVLYLYLNKIDLALVMSVEPGKGGQKFMPLALEKIAKLRKYIDENKCECLIEVDGGINAETGKLCKDAGADVLVAGSYLFGHEDIKERIESLR